MWPGTAVGDELRYPQLCRPCSTSVSVIPIRLAGMRIVVTVALIGEKIVFEGAAQKAHVRFEGGSRLSKSVEL